MHESPLACSTDPVAPDVIVTRNPASGEVLAAYDRPSPQAVLAAVAQARHASPALARASLGQRAAVLQDIARLLADHAMPLAQRVCRETGKTLSHALEADLASAIAVCRHTAHLGPGLLSPARLWSPTGALLGRALHQHVRPVGVVALITPWNYPMAIAASGLAPALMAGNAVVFKPSELAPDCAEALSAIVWQALAGHGLPPEALTLLIGDGQTGERLLDADIDHCLFTGSVAVGQQIRARLTPRHIPVSLELGGSCPMLVLERPARQRRRYLDAVVSHALFGRLANNGQACGAVKRLYVPHAYLPEVLDRLSDAMTALRVGSPDDPATHVGPLISALQRERLHGQVQDAQALGAQCLCGGFLPERPGWYYPPTLLAQVPPQARVWHEETFGPVLPVMGYDDPAQAVAMANDSAFALTASVFGTPREAAAVARQLHAPLVAINDVALLAYSLPQVPWRGRLHSGWGGGTHGTEILQALSDRRVTVHNHTLDWPLLGKPPWHFHRADPAQDAAFSARVLAFTGGLPVWRWLGASLARGFWQRRASRQW